MYIFFYKILFVSVSLLGGNIFATHDGIDNIRDTCVCAQGISNQETGFRSLIAMRKFCLSFGFLSHVV